MKRALFILALILLAAVIAVAAVLLAKGRTAPEGFWKKANDVVQNTTNKLDEKSSSSSISNNSNKKSDQELTLDDLTRGCFGMDCIPSIDDPKFVSTEEADAWLEADDTVFGLSYKGETRAYPKRILNWHEIVNDSIAGEPVAISFCPLCGSTLAFKRIVNGDSLEFGVSGYLYNSNLVMYDRNGDNKSYWQQATGEAIIGSAAKRGAELERIPMAPMKWSQWKEKHPDTNVLSKETGYDRNYSQSPYGSYTENDKIYFGVENTDKRLEQKQIVYGVLANETPIAFPADEIRDDRSLTDSVGDMRVTIKENEEGEIIAAMGDGEELVPMRTMWFAWAAFYPDTKLYKANQE